MKVECIRTTRASFCALLLAVVAVLFTPTHVRAAGAPETTASKAEPADTVRVAYNPGTILRLYAAFERDTFRKQRLNIELIRFESGAAASAAFAAGSVDIGFTGIPGFVSSRLAGANTRVFMIENDSGGAEGLVVRGQSGIGSVRDLAGKHIGTVVGTTSWMGLMSALQKAGIDPASVKIDNVPPSAWGPAFQRGDVDGLFVWSPALFAIAESGGKLITTMSEYRRDPLLWQARSDFLLSRPDVARRFVAALEEARPTIESRDPQFIARMAKETASTPSAALKTVEAIKLIPLADQVSDASPYSLTSSGGLKADIDAWVKLYIEKSIFRQQPNLDNALDPTAIRAVLGR